MGTRSRTHIVHREQEAERREGERRRVETGPDRRIEVTGVRDDGRERAQIRQIMDAADADERESKDCAAMSETRVGIRVRVGSGADCGAGDWASGERLSRRSPVIYAGGAGRRPAGGRPGRQRASG